MQQQVLDFWYKELTPKQWWVKDEVFDKHIAERFGELLAQAKAGELFTWRETAQGRLAEILVLDQFSRNIFRDSADAFSAAPMALALSQEAVLLKIDADLSAAEKAFLYMPHMHSESLLVHEQAVRLFDQPDMQMNYDFELKHKAIIEKFGRYPHRNAILNRASTEEEVEFLSEPGSGF